MPRLEPAVDREQLPQTIGDRVRVVRETFGVANEGCEGGRGHAVMTRRAAALFLADAVRLAAASSMIRSAAASPAPIVRERVRGTTAGDRPVTRAGETTTLASIARSWIRNTRAMTDASTTSPSDTCLPPSGTAIRFGFDG
jgi:hypothetical protein